MCSGFLSKNILRAYVSVMYTKYVSYIKCTYRKRYTDIIDLHLHNLLKALTFKCSREGGGPVRSAEE